MSLLSLLGVLSSTIFSGTSLLYATLGEVVNERAGIVNLGLEGVLLISAATGYGVTFTTGNPYLGVLAAMLAGGLVNLLFGYLIITRKANQLASGLAVIFFGYGLSALIGKPFIGKMIKSLPRIMLPGLEEFPLRYSSLFRFDLLIYLVVPIAIFIWWLLFRTRWGLGLRAVGENAETAYASGRNPNIHQIPGLVRRWFAGRSGRCPIVDCFHHELVRIHDRWARIYCDRTGDLLQVASHPSHRRGAGLQRCGCIPTALTSQRCENFTVPAGYDPLCPDHQRLADLGRYP